MVTRDWDCNGKEKTLFRDGRWQGPKLLTMAAIFDISKGVYTFSIMTMAAPEYMAWLHDRVPLIESIMFPTTLNWHQVGSKVGNVNNKGMDCVLPVNKKDSKPKPTMMDAWLFKTKANEAGPSTSTRIQSQSPLMAQPKNEPVLQVKKVVGVQEAVIRVKEEPAVQEKQEAGVQGKQASAKQPATQMKVEVKGEMKAESIMQLKEEPGVEPKKRRLD
ncbi:uncharacterized protein LOC119391585 isoform X2 [Rhipicephalus sanguineus]|uniref:uncharacterized protein LOC119391585 isoform X2 n=1 Tax=Rhipicephalus sanguineus TaxID=34632 RepID=UPI0018953FBD|nr:uncharacterized protein LOC119391585 isoform X2 [Rhipicephalus sanguineus]